MQSNMMKPRYRRMETVWQQAVNMAIAMTEYEYLHNTFKIKISYEHPGTIPSYEIVKVSTSENLATPQASRCLMLPAGKIASTTKVINQKCWALCKEKRVTHNSKIK